MLDIDGIASKHAHLFAQRHGLSIEVENLLMTQFSCVIDEAIKDFKEEISLL